MKLHTELIPKVHTRRPGDTNTFIEELVQVVYKEAIETFQSLVIPIKFCG